MSFHAAINIHFLNYTQAGNNITLLAIMHFFFTLHSNSETALLLIRQMSFHAVVSRHFLHYTKTGGNLAIYQQCIFLTLHNNS